jgi:hypothetical protein
MEGTLVQLPIVFSRQDLYQGAPRRCGGKNEHARSCCANYMYTLLHHLERSAALYWPDPSPKPLRKDRKKDCIVCRFHAKKSSQSGWRKCMTKEQVDKARLKDG